MKIGLIDVDGHNFPNLALMKIAAYHKSLGDDVEWYDPMFSGHMDKVYMSKIFTFTDDYIYNIDSEEIVKGGTGYFYPTGGTELPEEIEHIYPDYSIYYDKIPATRETAYGFLTRGCPRGCDFCIVGKKEGRCSKKVADLSQFWKGQKYIEVMDPNLLACSEWKDLLQQLIDSKATVNINQGMDIRFMTEEKAEMINKLKVKLIHFAWDNYEFETYEKLKKYRPLLKFNGRKLRVYVLVNFNTTLEQDLDRIYKLKELDYDPYVMIYEKWKAPKEIRRLQRWVNNKFIFRSCERFEDYKS
ncbi:radical SAM protein [Clostridium paraputrificum]|uniref:radical SAM protein n=1 Tax=Clostridium paraputrificum TaxID=29363 RepID=UPI003F641617